MDVSAPLSKAIPRAGHRVAESRVIDLLALTAVDGLGDDGVAHVLNQVRQSNSSLEDFYQSDVQRLQTHYGLRRAAAECVRQQASRLRADAVERLERARSVGVVARAPGDTGYPPGLEEFYDGRPPLLFARGNLELLEGPTVAVLSSSGTSSQSLTNALAVASRLAEAGQTLVTGAENPTYNLVGLAGKRAGANLIVVLHQGLLTIIQGNPEREPVPLARYSDEGFDPQRTLLLSPFRLEGRWQKSNGQRRDKLVVALAKTVVAMEVKPGGVVESLCREAIARKRRVFVCQPLEAAGRNLANEALIDDGACPLVPDAVGSNCDLVLKPLPTSLASVAENDDRWKSSTTNVFPKARASSTRHAAMALFSAPPSSARVFLPGICSESILTRCSCRSGGRINCQTACGSFARMGSWTMRASASWKVRSTSSPATRRSAAKA